MINSEELQSNAQELRNRVLQACDQAGRDQNSVRTIAVTKGFPVEVIREANRVGFTEIGENRVKEAVSRKEETGIDDVRWHMIGHVQSNKVKFLLGEFELIHSVDRESLINELQKRLERANLTQSVLLQVNLSGESSKHGVSAEQAPEILEKILEASRLEVEGLMTMASYEANDSELHETFSNCRTLRDKLESDFEVDLPELSMGMSNDFEQAIKEGSTMIRIGQGIFGPRPE